ncbi:transglutaminase-like domain-containing protein [Ruminococcus albus]|uniref:Transglutaminase-like superfamily protein n=1 Tax=Ruminococcus albus TaxID=1264 RepID=A0A1I1I4S8_RUMAL|nr:transglutaminase domain-containing protein [Ruminococcus albus]SFC31081.1 Transglutaminase-like superfamily protein [Ruminococcus albus]
MGEKTWNISAPMVFGAGAALTFCIWGGLYAAAAALLLCALTACLVERFGRKWGFLPAVCGALAAVVLHERFMAECALCADNAEFLYSIKRGALYVPVADAAENAYIVPVIACGLICGVYAAFGVRVTAVILGALAAVGYVLFGGNAFALCGALALAVSVCSFGAEDIRRAGLALGAAVLALPAVFIKMPEFPPVGEVSTAGGESLYMAEEYEQPHCSKAQYERGSAIITALSEEGFSPENQANRLMEAAGETLPTEEVEVSGKYVPAGVCGEISEGKYLVCPELNENIFRLTARLQEGNYIDCEGLYREYVYSAYGNLTAEEDTHLRERFGLDGTLPLDKKLAEVRKAVRAELSPENADSGDYAELTVGLARSCGIAAREVKGIYFDEMPESGRAKLADGERRVWSEVYIDGAGWVVFETSPMYEEVSPLLPEGASADSEKRDEDEVTSGAEDVIYTSAPPRTAAEIREETNTEKPSSKVLFAVPAGALAILLAAGRTRAAFRRMKRRKHDNSAALRAWHFQGKKMMELALGVSGLSPEEMAEKAEGLLRERFEESERAYEKLRFSDDPPDEEAVSAAKQFYEEARQSCRKQGILRSLGLWLRGLY